MPQENEIQQTQPQSPTRSKPKKKKWYLGCLGAVIGLILLIIIIAAISSSGKKDESSTTIGESTSQQEEEPKPDAKNEGEVNPPEGNKSVSITYKELESYEKAGDIWKSIVIPIDTNKEDLIKLAKDIHQRDPLSSYHIFDDDTKFQEYKDWDINYGKIKDQDGKVKDIVECINIEYCRSLAQQGKYAYSFPEEWVNKHLVADIQKMFTENKKLEWGLYDVWGILISNL